MAERIEQLQLNGGENTNPTLTKLRALFDKKIREGETTVDGLTDWLQCPGTDNNCQTRAQGLERRLWPEGSIQLGPGGKELTAKGNPEVFVMQSQVPGQWRVVKKKLDFGVPVLVKGPATVVGGDESNFKSGFHVVLFLAYGKDGKEGPEDGKKGPKDDKNGSKDGQNGTEYEYFVVFDPDISATAATWEAWKSLGSPDIERLKKLSPEELRKITFKMVLGGSEQGLGTLFRKYYVDQSRVLGSGNPAQT
jgi:hypothetical protein